VGDERKREREAFASLGEVSLRVEALAEEAESAEELALGVILP
jgi:hypothetical protein